MGSPAILIELLLGCGLLAVFASIERRVEQPMLPTELFASRRFTAAQLTVFAISASFFAIYLYVTLYLEEIRHRSPIGTGLVYLPATTLMFIASGVSIGLAERLPQAALISGSLGLVGLGIGLLLVLEPRSSWLAAEPGLLIAGVGAGVFNAVGSELALSTAPERHAGVASGVNDTFRQGGIPLGVAPYGALVPAGAALGRGSAPAFVAGFHHAVIVAGAIAIAGAFAAHRLLSRPGISAVAALATEAG
jgi:predicted MFS family arabinose efflux permease